MDPVLVRRYSEARTRGCPVCAGVASRTCVRCHGRTRQRDWYQTANGWGHLYELTQDEALRRIVWV